MPVNPMIGASGGNMGFFDSSSIGLRQDLGNYGPETQATITSEERKRRIANMLLQRGMQPRQGQMVGRFFTPPSKWEQGSDLAQAALGAYMNWDASDTEKKAVEAETEKVGRIRKSVAEALAMQGQGQEAIAAQPAHMVPTSGVGYEDAPAETMVPATQGSAAVPAGPASVDQRLQALRATRNMAGADSPLAMRLVDAEEKALLGEQTREDVQKQARDIQKENLAQRIHDREMVLAGQKGLQDERLAWEERKEGKEIAAKAERLQAEILGKAERQHDALEARHYDIQKQIEGRSHDMDARIAAQKLPPAVMKMGLDISRIATDVTLVNANMQRHLDRIESGELNLNLWANWISRGKNFTGYSDSESRAFTEFTNDVERSRNAILMAAKGVQTEGDATRALDAIMSSINDTGNVKQQIVKMMDNNRYLAAVQNNQLQAIMATYGSKATELTGLVTPPQGSAPPAAPVGTPPLTPEQRRAIIDKLTETRPK